ncbi:hypothetical protein T07_15059, partial [Trichinella nelsoni]
MDHRPSGRHHKLCSWIPVRGCVYCLCCQKGVGVWRGVQLLGRQD